MRRFKRLFPAAAVILALLLPICALAADRSMQPYSITAYHVDMDVSEDNVLSITEDIEVYFNQPRHGIYRRIPTRNTVARADGTSSVTKARVKNIACNEVYEKSTSYGAVILQIGSADVTVTGSVHYTISYDYVLGQDVGEGFDELYYNIIGDGWDAYISGVSFEITMPKEFDSGAVGFSSGAYGQIGTDSIQYSVDDLTISGNFTKELAPGEALTVRIELEEGYFYFNQALNVFRLCAIVLIDALCLLFVFVIWSKHGKDRKVIGAVEFYPPDGMSSADAAYWYKGALSKKDLVAMLIELANEGYVAINGGGKGEKYSIERIKDYPSGVNSTKQIFFQGLFESGKSVVTGDDLENNFYRTLDTIISSYIHGGEEKRLYTKKSKLWRIICMAATLICVPIDYFIFADAFGSARYAAFAVGLVILAGSFWLSLHVIKRTNESHRKLERLTGFKTFLETAEKDKLEALVDDDPKYFYNILPFAYVLGVSDKWVKNFEGIAVEPPNWYTGDDTAFTTAAMWYSMSRTLNSASKAMSSVAQESSSSSGGFSGGGGGFSGGGSGGGGGSSW